MESIYYTLVASLPHLPHFTKAERLPITRQRLRERLQMLSLADRELVQRAADFLAWQRQPATRRDAEMAQAYQRLQEKINSPDLWCLFAFPLNVRTVMAALRRRRRGLTPTPGEFWGVGPWVRHLERHWDHPDFKLANVFPWLPQARQLLETNAALELERFLMDLIWQHVERVAPGFEFSLRTVLAYLFKWDLLQLWLSQEPVAATQRFDSLVTGVLDDYGPIFA